MKYSSVQKFITWEYDLKLLLIQLSRVKSRRRILHNYGNLFLHKGDIKKSAVSEKFILSRIQVLKKKRDYAIIKCILMGRQQSMLREKKKMMKAPGLVTNSAPESNRAVMLSMEIENATSKEEHRRRIQIDASKENPI